MTSVTAAPSLSPLAFALPPEPPELPAASHDDDGNPYPISTPGPRPCPACHKPLAPEALLCSTCGFDLQTGQKQVKVYSHFEQSWESGWSFSRRFGALLASQVIAVPAAIGAW